MKYHVRDLEGNTKREVELPDSLFASKEADHLVHNVVKAYLANRRQGTHATKTRAFVSGGGKKPFRQKGTGNARQGTSRSPHMPGGAVSHGPVPRDYTQKINKKAKQTALKAVLTDKVKNDRLLIVDGWGLESYSTKAAKQLLDQLGAKSALICTLESDRYTYRSVRNLRTCGAAKVSQLNVEDLLRYEYLVLPVEVMTEMNKRLMGEGHESV